MNLSYNTNIYRILCEFHKGRQLCFLQQRLFYHSKQLRKDYEKDDNLVNQEDGSNKSEQNVKKKKSKIKGDLLFGIHPVYMAIQHGKRKINKLLVKEKLTSESSKSILKLVKEKEIKKIWVSQRTLDNMCGMRPHQGVCLDVGQLPVPELDLSEVSKIKEGVPPIWLMMHQIKDPMNVGGILRSAYFLGINRVILPHLHSGGLTAVVSKASSGAMEVISMSRCKNWEMTIELLQEWKNHGGLVVGTTNNGPQLEGLQDFSSEKPILLISGNENAGVDDELIKSCDHILTIKPANGIVQEVDSLNVSVATGIILHNLMSKRSLKQTDDVVCIDEQSTSPS